MTIETNLAAQVALVTGGGRGIGKAIALGLARAGAAVAIAGRDTATLESTASELRQLGVPAHAARADVSDVAQIEDMIADVTAALGPIDVLVNNAGVAILEPSTDVSETHWDRIIDTNLKGMFFCASRVAREMIPRGSGAIINVSSEEGIVGVPGHAAYCISKAGIIHMTKVLALEWGPHGIRVNCIAPAAVRTQMNEDYWIGDPEAYRWVTERIALGRVSEPEELVGAAVYLASSASAFVTGHTLVVDGGISAGMPRRRAT